MKRAWAIDQWYLNSILFTNHFDWLIENKHPFQFMDDLKKEDEMKGKAIALLNWKEITKKEFKKYQKLYS